MKLSQLKNLHLLVLVIGMPLMMASMCESNEDNDAATDGTANIIGDEIALTAEAGGIGQAFVLELDAATALDADTTADGSRCTVYSYVWPGSINDGGDERPFRKLGSST